MKFFFVTNSVLTANNYEERIVEPYFNRIVSQPKPFKILLTNLKDFGAFKMIGKLSLRVE